MLMFPLGFSLRLLCFFKLIIKPGALRAFKSNEFKSILNLKSGNARQQDPQAHAGIDG
jgi:hypothetical protein